MSPAQLLQHFGAKAVFGDEFFFLPLAGGTDAAIAAAAGAGADGEGGVPLSAVAGTNLLKTAVANGRAAPWDLASWETCMKAMHGSTLVLLYKEVSKDGTIDVDVATLPTQSEVARELNRCVLQPAGGSASPSLFPLRCAAEYLSHTHSNTL